MSWIYLHVMKYDLNKESKRVAWTKILDLGPGYVQQLTLKNILRSF